MARWASALAAVGFAVLVPINNILSVLVLSRYAGATPAPFRTVLRSVATNPLILSTLLASSSSSPACASASRWATRSTCWATPPSRSASSASAPLSISARCVAKWPLAAGVALRLAVMPAVTFGLAFALGLNGMALDIAMICVAAPVATSAYILARQLGGDARLMANIITLTTLLSLVTIPLTLWLVQLIG
jgi:malonate transporter